MFYRSGWLRCVLVIKCGVRFCFELVEGYWCLVLVLTLGVYYITILYIYYYIIIHYTYIIIIISYLILYSPLLSFPFPYSLPPIFPFSPSDLFLSFPTLLFLSIPNIQSIRVGIWISLFIFQQYPIFPNSYL